MQNLSHPTALKCSLSVVLETQETALPASHTLQITTQSLKGLGRDKAKGCQGLSWLSLPFTALSSLGAEWHQMALVHTAC